MEKESKKKLLSWFNTSIDGFLTIRNKDAVQFTLDNIKEIIEL